MMDTEGLSQVLRVRREKLDALNEKGIEPFAYSFDRTATAAEAVGAFEEAESAQSLDDAGHGATVTVGGRIVSWRDMGKSAFAHIEDASGRIQLYLR
ncbi:MAG: lysine--tRNA ligase, partial [Gemmatimonadota bacterium]